MDELSRRPSDLERLMAGIIRRPISRRRFLRAAAVTPAAAFLAACERRVSTTGGATATTTPPTVELEDELIIYNWANYLNPDNVKAFEEEYGVTVKATDFYESNEEMIAKLKGGATGYDIIAPTGGYVEAMGQEGLLLELDHSRLPNLANVESRYLALPWDPENKYSAPKDWGTTGFGYLTDRVEEELLAWKDFYGVAPNYSGKYTVLDSMYEVIGSGLKMLGYSYNSENPAEVDAAFNEVVKIKPHLAAITSTEYRQLMSRADTWLALGWNGDFFFIAEDQPSVKYVIPSEGTEFWIDTWAIPSSAPHPNLAHEFINWILTPERQGIESSFTYYASAVTGAQERTDPAVANDTNIFPPPEVTDRLEAARATPKIIELRQAAWDKFLAA